MKPKHVSHDQLVEKVWRLERLVAHLLKRETPGYQPDECGLEPDVLVLFLSVDNGGTDD